MIHKLSHDDIDDLYGLSREADWEHTPADWDTLLKSGNAFGHRNESGNVISSLVLTPFGKTMTALGMLIVRQENRRLGLATSLLRHAISESNPESRPLILCSGKTVEGYYQNFGFRTVERLSKLEAGPNIEIPDSGFSSKIDVHSFNTENLERVIGLDTEVNGYDRSAMLTVRAEQAIAKTVMLKKGGGTLLGYGFGIMQGEQMLIGPVIAFNRFTAQEIIREITKDHKGPVRIDVMDQRQDLKDVLIEAGFIETERQPIMLLGATELPGRRDHIFSPASQAWC